MPLDKSSRPGHAHADQRFAVGAHAVAQLRADRRQRAFFLEAEEQVQRAQRGGREDHAAAGEAAAAGGHGGGADREHLVAVASVGSAIERPDIHHLGFGEDLRAVLLGEVEVVLVQGVLGAVAAAHHAAAAGDATGAFRSLAAEIGVGISLAGRVALRPFEDGDPGAIEGVPYPVLFRRAPEDVIRRTHDPVLGDAQHAHRGVVVPRHLGFPIGQAGPRSVVPDGVSRDQRGIGVGDGAAAHRAAVHDQNVAEGIDVEEAAQAEAGPPDPVPDLPVRCRAGSQASSGGPFP